MQTRSVKCKLIVPQELCQDIDLTLERFADACNQILDVAKEAKANKQWNTTKLHHLTYKPVRAATGLKANHFCQGIRRAIGNAKAVKQVHKFRPTSIDLDLRTFSYFEETQTLGVTPRLRTQTVQSLHRRRSDCLAPWSNSHGCNPEENQERRLLHQYLR